jgi:replicative DNA helicase
MVEMAERGDRVDRVTLANELIKHSQLESVDGLSYLCSLDEGIPHGANVDAYVRIVKEKSLLRRASCVPGSHQPTHDSRPRGKGRDSPS